MEAVAIISVDGHVRASRTQYRDYIERSFLADYDLWVLSQEGLPDAGNLNPKFGESAQWDSDQRLRDLESNGVVGEVLFPNGVPFQRARLEDTGTAARPELTREGRRAYNRWLADFCAAAPGRRSGQALVSFDDIDDAVHDVYWAKERGLGGISLPSLFPGDIYFFDPQLDPFWAAVEDVGFPLTQHGGGGHPPYGPPGFAAILTLALEHSFYSGRSLWQMMLGGVFDRFPELQVVFVETGANWIPFKINELDGLLQGADQWTGFARSMNRDRLCKLTGAEYWDRNCHAGASPFKDRSVEIAGGLSAEAIGGFELVPHKVMFGVDYPHFESIFPNTSTSVEQLSIRRDLSDADIRAILYGNAATVFGFDLDMLAPDIERIKFTPKR